MLILIRVHKLSPWKCLSLTLDPKSYCAICQGLPNRPTLFHLSVLFQASLISRHPSHDYKTRLLSLNLLPLMHWYELQDMMFLVKCFKNPMDNLIIHDYVEFVTSITRASSNGKLRHKFCRLSTPRHFYFNRIVHLWNLFPRIDLSLSLPSIKHLLLNHLWSNFCSNFDANNVCSFHLLCPCAKCQL